MKIKTNLFIHLPLAYIDFHLGNIEDLEYAKDTREALCEKRLSEGWFLYAFIELKTRYLIPGKEIQQKLSTFGANLNVGPHLAKIDETLEMYNDIINKIFSKREVVEKF